MNHFYLYSTVYPSIHLSRISLILLVDCMTATISGPYIYTVTFPALLTSTITVNCQAGYAWTSSPSVAASRSATCSNVSGSGAWLINGNPQCACMLMVNVNCTVYIIVFNTRCVVIEVGQSGHETEDVQYRSARQMRCCYFEEEPSKCQLVSTLTKHSQSAVRRAVGRRVARRRAVVHVKERARRKQKDGERENRNVARAC